MNPLVLLQKTVKLMIESSKEHDVYGFELIFDKGIQLLKSVLFNEHLVTQVEQGYSLLLNSL